MGLFNLSSVKNHARRSGFDLSSKVAFSAKVGELLPIKWTLTMPGDKFNLKEQHFTRTQPVNTSAYTRVREYYDWFWCPLHLLCLMLIVWIFYLLFLINLFNLF